MEWGWYREALAWVSLICELYPHLSKYVMLKEKLKDRIHLKTGSAKNKVLKNETWDGIAGMYELKSVIQRDFINPRLNSQLYKKYNIPLPNGLLLYGPPGCGKSYFARKLAQRIKFNFLEASPSDIGSTYVHGSSLRIRELFEKASETKPTLLFIDEIDAIAPNRNRSDVFHHYQNDVNELLTQLDKSYSSGVIVIAATNRLSAIDEAILRPGRIDKKIFVGPPDYAARIEAFKLNINDFPSDNIRFDYIADNSDYYSFSEIKLICNEAKKEALEKHVVLDTNILMRHLLNVKPLLNEQTIQKYWS